MKTTTQEINFQTLEAFYKKIDEGVTIEELKAVFYSAIESKDSLIIEIDKMHTMADLKKRVRHSSGDKKADLVKELYDGLLMGFKVTEGLLSYSPYEGGFMGGTYNKNAFIEALTKEIEKTTQEDIDKNAAAEKAKREAMQKTFSNPETLKEFALFIQVKGKVALTPEQLEKYEALAADKTLEQKQKENEQKAIVKAVNINVDMAIQKTTHTLKGHDLWVIKLSERVEREVYNDLNTKVKKLGGYYSSYAKNGAIPGFTFTDEDAANKFLDLKNGNQKTDKYEDRKEESTENRINKFFAMAEDMETKGKEKLNQDRKDNTHRRAQMAASAEAKAENMIYWAKVLRNLGEKMEAGELKYLANISSFSQVEELKNILRNGFSKRSKEKEEERNNHSENLNFVSFPLPEIQKEHLRKVCESLANKSGQMRRAEKFLKGVNSSKSEYIIRLKESFIGELKTLISDYKGFEGDYMKEQIAKYDRIKRMGIDTIEVLKMALREFIPCLHVNALDTQEKKAKETKRLEREFIGKKIEGFFPTPEEIVLEMLAFAKIQESDIVLEPSAGLGHIADIIAEQNPDNILNCVEVNSSLAEALKVKGHHTIHMDFLQFNTQYDKIIMNPPFEDNQDITHVLHAYSLLRPGGRIVAIMGEGAFFRKGKTETNFRAWLDEIAATHEQLPEGSFKDSFRSTGVATRMVIIDK